MALNEQTPTRGRGARTLPFELVPSGALLAMLLTVQGCVHVPPAPIDPVAHARSLEQRALDDAAVATALSSYGLGVPGDARWTLDQLTIAGWVLRSDIAAARAELDAARAATRLESRRPGSGIATTFERVTNAATGIKPWVVGASDALTIETADKRDIRRERALAREEAAQWQLAQTLWDARVDLTGALFDRLFAERTLALDDEELRARRAQLEWIDTRLSFGAATTQERLVVAEALSQIESQRELDFAGLAAATARLASAVGVVPAAFARVTPIYPDLDALPDIDSENLAVARELALSNRLDVRRALADYDVAEQDLRAAVADQYPNIALGPGYLVDQGDRKITLSLDLPLLPSMRTAAAIDSAVALRAVAAARFDVVQENALAQIETSFASYRATLGALAAAESAEREAEQSLATARRRFDAGAADRGEVVGAEIGLLTRRRNSLDTRRALTLALAALQDGIQQPLYPSSSIAVVTGRESEE